NQQKTADVSVALFCVNRTRAGEGDDVVLKVDLTRVPADVIKVVFVVTIHEAECSKQNFGQLGGSFIRVLNEKSGSEV
ncbi:TerD family protein, partial [Pseudomonas syringae group genomosp. 7]|uniref:TerD family protein n=1 Tax=Pseudomonas syringae group genomosp. 7 TaxID=251699 RepID=UPI00376F9689